MKVGFKKLVVVKAFVFVEPILMVYAVLEVVDVEVKGKDILVILPAKIPEAINSLPKTNICERLLAQLL